MLRASLLCAPGTREARAALALALAGVLGLAAFLAYTMTGSRDPTVSALFNDGLYNAVQLLAVAGCALRLVLVGADRLPWALLTAGLASWATADLLFAFAYGNDPPYPSIADGFYLAFYPACYVGLLLLVRRHITAFSRSLWLDGVIAATGAAALAAAVLVQVVLETTSGSPAVVATNLAYPLGDILLLSVVVGVFALSGWRPSRAWLLLGLGFVCQVLADAVFLSQTARGTYVPGTPSDALWPMAMLLIAWAAWLSPAAGKRHAARPLLGTPLIAALVAIGILVLDHYHRANALALVFAVATLGVVLARMWLTFRENEQILARIREQAVTDALTGLANRRQLVEDLEHALDPAGGRAPRLLAIFDLNGFKRYNDTFGHPAGDVLLQRLGGKLAAAVAGRGTAYRLGGDEFCLLADDASAAELLDDAVAALSEEGESFQVTTSFGAVFLPDEAPEAREALRLADQRLYAQKYARELTHNRPHELLLAALSEREPGLLEHSRSVASLSLVVGRRLGLSEHELSVLRISAELHDVGKLAIPDAILRKPTELTADEQRFIEQHTIIGQRIVSATPALQEVGAIVRASHERWDGTGYTDGLVGDEIPLGARIIAVCDAFKAMTAERPYGRKVPGPVALAELRRCAGTQFDPAVVEAFADAVADGELDLDEAARSPRYSPADPALQVAIRAS